MRPTNKLIDKLKLKASAGLDKRVHDDIASALSKVEKTKPAHEKPNIWRTIMKSRITKYAAAAAVVIIVFAGLHPFGGKSTSVAWADIAERFESVPFFSVAIYLGNDGSGQAKKVEIWKSDDSRIRAQEDNKVIFADFSEGKINVIGFDHSTGQPVNVTPDSLAKLFIGILCPEGRFSLDTLVKNIPSKNGIQPVQAADTPASDDTVIFEVKSDTTPERILIWALRESKLPVRIRFNDPRNGECSDFLFDYSQNKNSDFFNPDVFESRVKSGQSE